MTRGARQTLLWITLLLVLFPLAVVKPGLPGTFKSDEPAYYLMALSLFRDGDLRAEPKDIERLFEEFPYFPADNLILMTDDGWRTVFFGKPYVYSLFAAPFAGLAGANGIVSFNMLLLMAMVWMGALYLRRYNPDWLAVAFSAGFFLLSSGFAYVFWMHPEIFNMAGVMGCLFFAFVPAEVAPTASRLRRWLAGAAARPVWSAACLAPAAYNKPMLALFALPALWLLWRRDGWRPVVRWCAAALVAGGLVAGISAALTGHPSAYMGVFRRGWNVHGPEFMPPLMPETKVEEAGVQGSWWWIVKVPEIDVAESLESFRYFLVGRHTGLFVYMPFSLLALVYFLFWGRRERGRWMLLATLLGVALTFLLWIPFNWHGGGGFVGNRYFVTAYPGFLFLATRLAPAWLAGAGYAFGGLVLGALLFTPLGAPVTRPTLQWHVRNAAFDWFPFEFGLRNKIPGYWGALQSEAWFYGRKDIFEVHGAEMWFHGGTTVEVWLFSNEPLDGAVFRVRSPAPTNVVTLRLGGDEQRLEFTPDDTSGRLVTLRPGAADHVRTERVRPPRGDRTPYHEWRKQKLWVYVFEVESKRGVKSPFYAGAKLSYLGPAAVLERELFAVDWLQCDFPERAAAGELFAGTVRLRNASGEVWPSGPAGRLQLAYHWFDAAGDEAVFDGRRTPIGRELAPGEEITVIQSVRAPAEPGRYLLQVDPIFEFVDWFSRRGAETCDVEVEIEAPG